MGASVERLTIWIAALLCLLTVGSLRDLPVASPHFAQKSEGPALAAGLVVRVLANEAPFDGAEVRVFGERDGQAVALGRAETTSGNVRFEGLSAGPVWLVVFGAGHARMSRRVVLAPGEQEAELVLAAASSFEVVVVDAAQRPIRNAAVYVHAGDPIPSAAYTDPSGLAAFEALGLGPYAVEVVAVGFARVQLRELEGAESPLFVKLERDAQLIVHVLDSKGAPASDATVLVAGSTLWPAKQVLSDGGGRSELGGLPRGFYELRATRGAEVSEVSDGVLLEPGEQREVELHLVEGTFIDVFVTDGAGDPAKPVAEAEVALVEGGLSSFPIVGRTDAEGLVRLGPIVGGDATASADAVGFVPRHAVLIEQGQGGVRVPLSRAGKLAGRVTDERGYPIEGVALEVLGVGVDGMPIADSALLIGLRSDYTQFRATGSAALVPRGELGVMGAVPGVPLSSPDRTVASGASLGGGLLPWASRRDGTFELGPVTPGRVQILARHPNYVDTLADAVTLGPGGSVDVPIVMRRGGTLEGRVFEGNRRPVAAARIELLSPDGAVERITFSADDGGFAFAAVPQDVVLAVARTEEPETIILKLNLEVPPDARRVVELALPERRDAITIRVLDDRGFRLDRVELAVASLDPETALTRTAFSDSAGEAVVAGARGLPLRLVVRRRGHAPLVTEIERAPAELTLALASEVSLDGEVHAREGWQKGASITLLTPSGDRHAKTDEAGRFHLGELAPGRARILVMQPGFAFEEHDVSLEPDSRGRVALPTIELSRGGSLEGIVVDDHGVPVTGARVAFGRVPTYLPAGPLPPGVTETDGAGRFLLVDLEAGEASVEAYKSGTGRASLVDLEVRAGDSRRDLRLELAPEPDAMVESASAATLAVTMSEHQPASRVAILLDHVPYGGEAQRAGLLAGDELTRIDGIAAATLEQARQRLDGPLAHDMVLELYRPKTGTYRVRVRREKLRP